MFVCRFFFFHLYESPKYLLSRGRQAEAVATVHGIAYKNKRKTWLTEEILNEIGGDLAEKSSAKLSTKEILQRQLGKFSTERIAPLFATRRLGTMSQYNLGSFLVSFASTNHANKLPASCPNLVLLGNDRNGLPALQRLPATISPKRRQKCRPHAHEHCLPQLRHHVHRRRARLHHRLLHGRYEVHWAQGHDCHIDAADGDYSFLVYHQL